MEVLFFLYYGLFLLFFFFFNYFLLLIFVYYSYEIFLCRANKDAIVYACDCSDETLEKAKEIIATIDVPSFRSRLNTFCCDFSTARFPNWLACNPCRDKFSQNKSHCFSGYFALP